MQPSDIKRNWSQKQNNFSPEIKKMQLKTFYKIYLFEFKYKKYIY